MARRERERRLHIGEGYSLLTYLYSLLHSLYSLTHPSVLITYPSVCIFRTLIIVPNSKAGHGSGPRELNLNEVVLILSIWNKPHVLVTSGYVDTVDQSDKDIIKFIFWLVMILFLNSLLNF